VLKQFYDPPGVFAPVNIYSHGVRAARMLTIAGQAPLDENGAVVGIGDAATQCRRVFSELKKTLDMAGATFADVVYVRAYVTSREVLPILRVVAVDIFGANRPAFSSLIIPSVRAPGALVEVELICECAD
jgi:enamine deaminase RidA (YjgF/YER057c/UK114 family)